MNRFAANRGTIPVIQPVFPNWCDGCCIASSGPSHPASGLVAAGWDGIKAKLVTAAIYLQDFGIVLKIVF